MKKILLLFMTCVMLVTSLQLPISGAEGDVSPQFKVMGYFCETPFTETVEEAIQFDGLTHLIYGFLKPKADGTFYEIAKPELLKELVEKSHAHHVKVIISIGGVFYNKEPLSKNFESLSHTEAGRNNFLKGVANFIDTYGVDGVELDWEYPTETSQGDYEKLVRVLKDLLKQKEKTLSAAVAGAGSLNTTAASVASVSKTSLDCFDWINIMAYDLGSGLSGQHSPYWFANVSIDYWLKRGVSAEKIILGVPLYARPSWKQYRNLVAQNPENAYVDYVKGEKLDSYYNGLNMISEKTRLALYKAGGLMFFDIHEDTHDETSCQKATHSMIERYAQRAEEDLFIVVENHELMFNSEDGLGTPYIDESNRTMVPLRKALETIGVTVLYDQVTKMITAKKGETEVQFIVGQDQIHVNGSLVEMDTKITIKGNRTYLPLRWIYESFGYEIVWHSGSKTIYVD